MLAAHRMSGLQGSIRTLKRVLLSHSPCHSSVVRCSQSNTITTSAPMSRSRENPDEPRVGVGVVVFKLQPDGREPEVLLIRRAKEPAKGEWCFPGGSLELGETISECAVREVMEETGVTILNQPDPSSEGISSRLSYPTPFAAVDSIVRNDQGGYKYHYAVIDVAAIAAPDSAEPQASDDVDAVQWVPASQIRGVAGLTRSCARFVEEALVRFDLGTGQS